MSHALKKGLALLRAPANELGFALRSSLRWGRGAPGAAHDTAAPTFGWAAVSERACMARRAASLDAAFELAPGLAGLAPEVRARNYARLAQLERLGAGNAVPRSADGGVRAVDLCAGDFHYAPALAQWLSRAGGGEPRPVALRGVELDGHGVYADGHSRADHGRARAAAASVGSCEVCYEVGDATSVPLPEHDVVTIFFPFLSPYACLRWGAPLSRMRPQRLVERAVRALRPGGWLVVANQTAREFVALRRRLARLPVTRIARASFSTHLVPEAQRTAGQIGSIWLRQEGVPRRGESG